MDRTTQAAIAAIKAAPCSLRALARQAGVSHVLLVKIRNGEIRATSEVAEALAAALEDWERSCGSAARRIRRLPTT